VSEVTKLEQLEDWLKEGILNQDQFDTAILQQLENWLKSGILTKEEFEKAKTQFVRGTDEAAKGPK